MVFLLGTMVWEPGGCLLICHLSGVLVRSGWLQFCCSLALEGEFKGAFRGCCLAWLLRGWIWGGMDCTVTGFSLFWFLFHLWVLVSVCVSVGVCVWGLSMCIMVCTVFLYICPLPFEFACGSLCYISLSVSPSLSLCMCVYSLSVYWVCLCVCQEVLQFVELSF